MNDRNSASGRRTLVTIVGARSMRNGEVKNKFQSNTNGAWRIISPSRHEEVRCLVTQFSFKFLLDTPVCRLRRKACKASIQAAARAFVCLVKVEPNRFSWPKKGQNA